MSDSVARYSQMVAQHPANELARFSLAKALFDQGEPDHAKPHFEEALVRRPDWMVAQILLARCHLATGNRELARTAFERARQLAIEQNHEGPLAELNSVLSELN